MYHKLIKVHNDKKGHFDHSSDTYYRVDLSDEVKLLFSAFEINKALDRYKKWMSKSTNNSHVEVKKD